MTVKQMREYKNGCKGLLIGLSLMPVALHAGAMQSFLSEITAGSVLHRSSSKADDRYELYPGPMEYREQSKEEGQEGYLPSKQQELIGSIERRLYDYSHKDSSYQIYRKARALLQRHGFEELYHCEQLVCGDVDGWRLYLSEEIGGNEKNQYYLVAKRGQSARDQIYIVFYVNDLDTRPRSLIHFIRPSMQAAVQPVAQRDELSRQLHASGRAEVAGIYFDFDSAQLKSSSDAALKEVIALLENEPALQVYIVGHSDKVGVLDYNLDLSKRRAESVVAYLTGQGKIEAERVKAFGVGPLAPALQGGEAGVDARNRRVEVVLR